MFHGEEQPLRRMLAFFPIAGRASHILHGKQSNMQLFSEPEENKGESCEFFFFNLGSASARSLKILPIRSVVIAVGRLNTILTAYVPLPQVSDK